MFAVKDLGSIIILNIDLERRIVMHINMKGAQPSAKTSSQSLQALLQAIYIDFDRDTQKYGKL